MLWWMANCTAPSRFLLREQHPFLWSVSSWLFICLHFSLPFQETLSHRPPALLPSNFLSSLARFTLHFPPPFPHKCSAMFAFLSLSAFLSPPPEPFLPLLHPLREEVPWAKVSLPGSHMSGLEPAGQPGPPSRPPLGFGLSADLPALWGIWYWLHFAVQRASLLHPKVLISLWNWPANNWWHTLTLAEELTIFFLLTVVWTGRAFLYIFSMLGKAYFVERLLITLVLY